MKIRNYILMLILLILGMHFSPLTAQHLPQQEETKISIEVDPTTFLFNGYSAHIRVQPKNMLRMLIGAGTYALDLPSVFVDLNSANRDEGWHVRISQAYALFAEHHFTRVNHKWFVGGQTSYQEFKINHEHLAGSNNFSNLLFRGYGGYTFQPFPFKLYFKPWAGVGYSFQLSGANSIGHEEYDLSPPPLFLFATLHVGYTF